MRPVYFRPQAEAEAFSARDWCEVQRPGLGARFSAALIETVDKISYNPEAFPRVHNEIRRALLRQFPYAVYFAIREDAVIVIAVMHGHRDPRRWLSRA